MLAELAAQARREGACLPYAIALGGRYPILVQHAADLAPFVQLGECYEELGVAALAHRVYRALAVASAGEAAEQVALPLARTALAARDLGVVRTAAAGQIRRAPRVAFQWLLLLGEAERLDGKLERAAELLRGLVQNGQPEGAQLRAVLAFARTLERLPPAPADREILSRAVAQVPAAERERDPTDFGEAALLAAEIERRADRRRAARRLYAAAAETLPPGPVRAQALYWRGALDLDLAAAGSIWERAAGEETGGPWRRLAALESSMADLRRQLGAVAPPDATGAGGAR